jgi:predicted membrane chloride channel (bestrophin family)
MQKNKFTKEFYFSSFWRYITNIWTVALIGVVMSDFLTLGKYHYLLTPFSVVYGAVLSIFVGTKEFNRWYDLHEGRKHPGEVFVVLWSLLFLVMVSISWIYGGLYVISADVVSVYIMVLTVFAITQSSKTIYEKRRR